MLYQSKAQTLMFIAILTCSPLCAGWLSFVTVSMSQEKANNVLEAFRVIQKGAGPNRRGNIVDWSYHRSSEGVLVGVTAEICQTNKGAEEVINSSTMNWTCNKYASVTDRKDKIVGKRTVCETGNAQIPRAVIYTYNDVVFTITGPSLDLLLTFESQMCVRSKQIKGVECKN